MTENEQPEEATPENDAEQAPSAEDAAQAEKAAERESGGETAGTVTETADETAFEPEARIAQLETEVSDLNDKLLRALAETENIRRRAQRDREDASKYAISNFAREMLRVADNLKRALDSVAGDEGNGEDAVDTIVVGLEMTEREMLATFERFGIRPIDALGAKFDHNFHEAMFEVEDKDKPAGTVMQVLETGYVLNDRLLRPAKVGVTKGGPKAEAAGEEAAAGTETEASDNQTRDGQAAYEKGPDEAGGQLDEEL